MAFVGIVACCNYVFSCTNGPTILRSHAQNLRTWYMHQKKYKVECGPMPNVMAALPNIGGALCLMLQSFTAPSTSVPCSNAAKTWDLLKLAGVPQTNETISSASMPKFTILWGRMGEITSFFSIVDYALLVKI